MFEGIMLTGFADEIDMSLVTQIEVIKKLGINYIEMRGVNGKGLVEHSLDEVVQIKAVLDAAGIKISAIGSPIGKIKINEDFASHFELFQHTVKIAQIMDTPYIRMFSFYMPEDENPDLYQERVFQHLIQLIEYAKIHQIVLLHENEKGIYGDNAKRCLNIMKHLYCDNFKAVFDFANFVQCHQDTLEAYKLLKPYLAYIHIKDAVWTTGEVVPAGHGDGHLEEILIMLKDSGYRGFLSLEPHLQEFGGFTALENDEHKMGKRKMTGEEAYTLAYRELCKILAKI